MDLLQQMATFVRVVEAGSLSGAARAQRLSLPAVSRQLQALEDELGGALIVRSTRRLRVTEEGERWYQHCVRILREVSDAKSDLSRDRAIRGRLTISAPATLASAFLLPGLSALRSKHPGLQLDLRLEDQVVDLVASSVDVVIRGGLSPPDSASFVARPLLSFRREPVASGAYLRRRRAPRTPAELAGHECLVQLGGLGAIDRWTFERAQQTSAISAAGAVRSNSLTMLRDLAVAGMGVALLPDWLVQGELSCGRLRRLLPGWQTPLLPTWIIHRIELRGSPRLRAFLDEMSPR